MTRLRRWSNTLSRSPVRAIALFLACLLAICSDSNAQAEPAKNASEQDAMGREAGLQGESSASRDGSFEQATRLIQQGKNDEALALLESIAATEPATIRPTAKGCS
jgi:hypothetical protein